MTTFHFLIKKIYLIALKDYLISTEVVRENNFIYQKICPVSKLTLRYFRIS